MKAHCRSGISGGSTWVCCHLHCLVGRPGTLRLGFPHDLDRRDCSVPTAGRLVQQRHSENTCSSASEDGTPPSDPRSLGPTLQDQRHFLGTSLGQSCEELRRLSIPSFLPPQRREPPVGRGQPSPVSSGQVVSFLRRRRHRGFGGPCGVHCQSRSSPQCEPVRNDLKPPTIESVERRQTRRVAGHIGRCGETGEEASATFDTGATGLLSAWTSTCPPRIIPARPHNRGGESFLQLSGQPCRGWLGSGSSRPSGGVRDNSVQDTTRPATVNESLH